VAKAWLILSDIYSMMARVSQMLVGVDLCFLPLPDKVKDKEIRAKSDQIQDKQGEFCLEVTTINDKKILALLRAHDKQRGQSIHTVLGKIHCSKHHFMPLFHSIDPSYNDAEATTFIIHDHPLSEANAVIENIMPYLYHTMPEEWPQQMAKRFHSWAVAQSNLFTWDSKHKHPVSYATTLLDSLCSLANIDGMPQATLE
jgi:hypothetical protein